MPFPTDLPVSERIDFESLVEGGWQSLPPDAVEKIERIGPTLIVKFGMGLLRVPRQLCPILSYHHGNPAEFRGRPAGFYELISGQRTVGQVVQVLSDRLDSGQVVAFGESRVHPQSYRSTMAEAFRASPFLLRQAVENALSDRTIPIEREGRNYRLPSNFLVARFAAKLTAAKVSRLFRGLFVEKAWQVAEAILAPTEKRPMRGRIPPSAQWRIADTPAAYRFIADPFPHPRKGLLVEGLRRSDGQGEIVHLDGMDSRMLCSGPGHFSYPATIAQNGGWFIVPEVSEWSPAIAFRLTGQGAEPVAELQIEGRPKLVDPTLFAHEGRLFLFGNILSEGSNVLRLWIADNLFSPFAEHPSSPVRISPAGSRMAGALATIDGELLRIGQDCTGDYGNGVVLFNVAALTPTAYSETEVGRFRFSDVKGPHTLNFRDGDLIFDFYRDRFTPLAGIRRIRARRAKRKAIKLT